MAHHIRFLPILGISTLTILATTTGLIASQPAASPTMAAPIAATPPTIDPDATDRELICRLLKALGKPCPPENFVSYEDYYAEIEVAWGAADPDELSPAECDQLLAAALDVYDSQTPAPAGVDPAAHANFILVLDEIIYEMGA